ncbi:hypothetical protein MMC29_000954 [Sticta canariensis]|nr:hypothetical protein [Sticta canariensis]
MSSLKVLSLMLLIAVARATPYLNFNPKDDTDKARLQKLHDVIGDGEMRAISSYGQLSAQALLAPYKRYFLESDEEDDFQTHVEDVLRLIAGTSGTDGAIGTVVGTFVVDNLEKLGPLRQMQTYDFKPSIKVFSFMIDKYGVNGLTT